MSIYLLLLFHKFAIIWVNYSNMREFMAITINDIAKKAGVSLATVSRVLNKSPHVSDTARRKVEQAIREFNYIPSAYARGLSRNQSNIIGVIVPEITNPFFSEVITGITEIGDKHNLNALFFNTDESIDKERRALRILQEYRVRGLIITPVTGENRYDREYIQLFENLNIPIVLVDRDIRNSDFTGVYFDDYAALFKPTSLLIENGHKDIVLFTGNPDHIVSKRRLEGYCDAFSAHQMAYNPKNLIPCDFSMESSYNLTRKLILDHNLPTAFIGMTNMLSLGCLKALYEFGISIPDEVAFVGYDRLDVQDVFNMHLTLVEKDAKEMGRKATELLYDKIMGKKTSTRTILTPQMFIRGSERFPSSDPNLRIF